LVLIGIGGGFALFDAGLTPIAFVLVAVVVAAVMAHPAGLTSSSGYPA